jgi:uncharacterized membrane protein (GlpM family)
MNGTILHFDRAIGTGVLRAEDGKRYSFTSKDWSSAGVACTGDHVDFEPNGTQASDIFVTSRTAPDIAPAQQAGAPSLLATPEPAFVQDMAEPQTASQTVSTATPSVTMPTGNSAFFFVAYLLSMIPTYILPYLGSNSVAVNGLGRVAGGGMPMQFWWHLTCYAVLIFLAYTRGIRIARGWLIALPIVAMVFDFVPGLSSIPLIPTIINLGALFVGTTRSAPVGFAPDALNKKIEWSLWSLAAFCGLVLFNLFTSQMNFGSPFTSTLLIWPVFAAALYFAVQTRADNDKRVEADDPAPHRSDWNEETEEHGESIKALSTNKFPTEDQADATPASDEGTPATTFSSVPWFKTQEGRIAAGATILVVAGGIALFASQNKRQEFAGDVAAADAAAAGTAATDPAITGQETSLYIIADANVRDRATAQGSNVVTKIPRGAAITGTMEIGADQTSAWFKLADGRGYIGGVNLSPKQPPALAKTFADMKWNVETGTDVLESPTPGSAVVARLNFGDQTTIAGVTANGYAEVKRSRGGVGYFLVNAGNDRNGTLAVNGAQVAGAANMAGETRLVGDVLNLDTVGVTEYAGQIGDQITTLKFQSDASKQLLFGDASYRNAVTNNVCNTVMRFKSISASGRFELDQDRTKMAPVCRHHATLVVTPVPSVTPNMPPETLQISWMLGGQKLMSGALTILGTD